MFGKPTAINNVETLINVLEVLRVGADAYAAIGSESSTGPRLFCLSGHVERPGVYEVEHGATLRELIEMAGGVRGGAALKAVLLGGAAGGFVGPDMLDAKLTFEDARQGGYALGSGVIMVFDESADLRRPRVSGSLGSSATRAAGSVSHAGSARCGRKRRSTGSSRARRSARRKTSSP